MEQSDRCKMDSAWWGFSLLVLDIEEAMPIIFDY